MSVHLNRQWIMDFTSGRGGALFSPCKRYRYTLWRKISDVELMPRAVNFLMLNPSTADETDNDATIERCERRAKMWGFDVLIVTNLFAWRSTDPAALKKIEDPVGPDNDYHIVHEAKMGAALVVCAWGNHGAINGRADHVTRLLREAGVPLTCLKRSEKTGQPAHPLYLKYDAKPVLWEAV